MCTKTRQQTNDVAVRIVLKGKIPLIGLHREMGKIPLIGLLIETGKIPLIGLLREMGKIPLIGLLRNGQNTTDWVT